MKRKLSPPEEKIFRDNKKKYYNDISTCPDYSSSLFFISKNEEEAIPPGGKKYLGTTKVSTRMILVHVQKMYKTCYSTKHVQKMYNIFGILIEVPDYSSSFFLFFEK